MILLVGFIANLSIFLRVFAILIRIVVGQLSFMDLEHSSVLFILKNLLEESFGYKRMISIALD